MATKPHLLQIVTAFAILAVVSMVGRRHEKMTAGALLIGTIACAYLDTRYEQGMAVQKAMAYATVETALCVVGAVIVLYLLRRMYTEMEFFGNGAFHYFVRIGGGLTDLLAVTLAASVLPTGFPEFLIIFILACFCNAWYGRRQPGSVHVFIPSVMSGYCIMLGAWGLIELVKMVAGRI